jgi:DNA-binding MarR family transcriptional regulator
MSIKIESIISEIEGLISQIGEKKYFHNEQGVKQLLKENEILNFSDVSLSECHVIACIAKNSQINGIEIAKQLGMTRGGISKIATRLTNKKLITTYRDETNQKKVFYKLTPLGEKVNEIHEQLHTKKYSQIESIASRYTEEEQDIILRFIKDLKEIK